MKKWVYVFNVQNRTDGNRDQKNLLGGKGANLAEMAALGLPVPCGITISTEACLDFYKQGRQISPEIREQVLTELRNIETHLGKKFGDDKNPLLFSVRSGARVSMPGMMDTVLNLGMNDKTVEAVARQTNNERFAWDSYRRFIQMFSNVVLELNMELLEHELESMKKSKGTHNDTDLTAEDLKKLVSIYKKIVEKEKGHAFPQDPHEQLWHSIGAVFNSWNNDRALTYRNLYGYSHDWGTAVNVQSMVFGNMGEDCATGVCFTRNPSNGEKALYGEYLVNAQGEDVVAGIRTPGPIDDNNRNDTNRDQKSLKDIMPKAYAELIAICDKLEHHYKDMQDIEFTIEKNKLYMLQCRNGKRTAFAALKIAVDLVNEKLLTTNEAVMRVKPEDLNQLLHPRLDPKAKRVVLGKGLPASPGAAVGRICLTPDKALETKANKEKALLVRIETSPEDLAGMVAAEGILTARGGMTSHAAVVARGMGKPCVAGCSALSVDYKGKTATIGNKTYKEGDFLSLDGATGEIMEGKIPTIEAGITDDFAKFMKWADETRKLRIRTNADTPHDAEVAVNFGAEGIGLCRTEHMFFAADRILAVREMIFADNTADREKALDKLLPFQRDDFAGIFRAMKGRPVNIRLLDPPLHEFLPHEEHDKQELSKSLKISMQEVEKRNQALFEFNPMLGHRGCRLAITYPEIYKMQARAIIEAALLVTKEGGEVHPEIMIPLVLGKKELEMLRKDVEDVAAAVFKEKGKSIPYKVGTMIEIPRAAITSPEIAPIADFFSFGTNDLTQTTMGISRDDSGKFLPVYVEKGIWECDPFVSIDESGVGFLMKHTVTEGKKANSKIHIGICGEHGGDPKSINFCHTIGLDYVSCSPFRVPIARLAAAQAALADKDKK
ncbi:MAG: pyruvate, phosphate dikinase [Oligoflexia bacterium]|nr:pyruvate, phosphate dikinase [Oligoflexia bacterium]MBF0367021.1 pyruvate, phosphate dikinase [Oligoflexia bacterium]